MSDPTDPPPPGSPSEDAETLPWAPPGFASSGTERCGDFIGRYRLLNELGKGGFGIVWRAEQNEPIHREVALKVIKPGMDSREIVARFEAERQALALMDHPNIAGVLDAGTTEGGRPFFVMELVDGVPITTYCDKHQLGVRERLELFIPVCQAVQHAHQKAILHRDLKPSNILVAEVDGAPVPLVIDFGIAKALHATAEPALHATLARTLDGMVVGTPQDMSPEQAGSRPDVDTRSDLYTLGVILYELLVGEPPLSREQIRKAALDELLRLIREVEPRRPSSRFLPITDAAKTTAKQRHSEPRKLGQVLRGDLDWIVLKALDKDRSRRYETANAFAQDLRRYLNDEPVSAGPPSAGYRLRKFVRRNQFALGAAAAIAGLLVAGIAVSTWQAVRATRAESLATTRLGDVEIQKELAEAATKNAVQESRRALDQQHVAEQERERATEQQRVAEKERERATVQQHMAEQESESRGRLLEEAARSDRLAALEKFNNNDEASALAHLERAVRYVPDSAITAEMAVPMILASPREFSRAVLIGHRGPVTSVAFSPDNRLVLTASSDSTARLWDATNGAPISELKGHTAGIYDAIFNKDGTRILTASSDHTARLWDTESGATLTEFIGHGSSVESAVFSPDERQVLTGSRDGSARLWDAQGGASLAEFKDHAGVVDSVVFSPDGRHILIGDNRSAELWELQSRKLLTKFEGRSNSESDAVFSPDGKHVLTCNRANHSAQLWNTQTGALHAQFNGHADVVSSATFSPDGTRVLTASDDYTARFWHAEYGRFFAEFKGHTNEVIRAEFSPDGERVLTASADGTARLWEARSGAPLAVFAGHTRQVQRAVMSPDGLSIATASDDGTARLWDATGLGIFNQFKGHTRGLNSAVFSPNGRLVLTASDDLTARLWNRDTRALLTEFKGHTYGVYNAIFSPDGKRILTASSARDKSARLWDPLTGEELDRCTWSSDYMVGLAFHSDVPRVFTQADEDRLRIWNVQTSVQLAEFKEHIGPSGSVDLSPDGQQLLLTRQTNDYNSAQLLEIKTGVRLAPFKGHTAAINSAVFSADGTRVLTASDDHTARVWDRQTGEPLTTLKGHAMEVVGAVFSPDGQRVASTSRDNTVRLWDTHSGVPIALFKDTSAAQTVVFSPDGRHILTALGNSSARIWDIPPHDQPPPPWLRQFLMELAGHRYGEDGLLHPLPGDQAGSWSNELKAIAAQPGDDYFLRLLRWRLSPPAERTTSTFN